MPGFFDSLGQGLQGAGAILSPSVFEKQGQERERMLQALLQQQQFKQQLIANAIQTGAFDPSAAEGLGVPGLRPDARTRLNEEQLSVDQQAAQVVAPFLQRNDYKGALAALSQIPGGSRAKQFQELAILARTQGQNTAFTRLNPKDYTPESLKKYQETGQVSDLEAIQKDTRATQEWSEPFMLNGATVQKNLSTGEIRTAVSRVPASIINLQTTAGDGSTIPGAGKNVTILQDRDSGEKYATDKAGRAWKLNDDDKWVPISLNNVPANAQKFGAGTQPISAREAVFTSRVLQSANQAALDLANVTKLPITSSRGFFGGRGQPEGLFNAGKETLANKMTTQEVQAYNVMSTGFQRSLAAIESAGLMPSGMLTHQMDGVIFKEGDTNLTKLHKLAQTRQIVESGMDVMQSNPRVSQEEKKKASDVLTKIRTAVPFTHGDLIKLQEAQSSNPNATLRSVLDNMKSKTNNPIFDQADAIIRGDK